MKRGIVIGGSLSGLVSASVLAARGYEITLLEKQPHLGGKLQRIELGEDQFELGSSMITMPWIFEQIYKEAGKKISPKLRFIPLATSNRHFFSDGSIIDLSPDPHLFSGQLSRFSHKNQQGFIRYLKDVQKIYEVAADHHFSSPLSKWSDFFTWSWWKQFLSIHPFQSLDAFHRRYFDDPRLLAIMNRYASYLGSSPYQAPAFLSFFSYLELVQGVYYIEGGSHRLIEAFTELAREVGVNIRTQTPVESILTKNDQSVHGVRTKEEFLEADFVISTVDEQTVSEKMLHRKAKGDVSSNSAFLCLLSCDQQYNHIHHHNFFYPSDYGREFVDIFEQEEWTLSPSIYIGYTGYSEPDLAKNGSKLAIWLNAPPDADNLTPSELEQKYQRYEEMVIHWLENDWGFRSLRHRLTSSHYVGPRDFAALSGTKQGALFSKPSHGVRSFWPSVRDWKINRLYYTGGATHFGTAMVMSVHSGLQIVEEIEQEKRMQRLQR